MHPPLLRPFMFSLPSARSLLAACRPAAWTSPLSVFAPPLSSASLVFARGRHQLAPRSVKFLKRHKGVIPYYAALLRLLHDRPATEGASTSLGKQVLEDFWKGFQAFLDKQAWRETRLCVRIPLAHWVARDWSARYKFIVGVEKRSGCETVLVRSDCTSVD